MITETFKGLIHELVSEAVDDPRDWREISQSIAQQNNKQRRMDKNPTTSKLWHVKLHGATATVQKLNNGKGVPEYYAQVHVKRVNDLEKRGDSLSKHFKRGFFSTKDPSIDDVKAWLRSVEEKLKERDRKATPKHMGARKKAADRAEQEKREREEAEARAKQEAEEAQRREYEERRAAEYRAEQEEEDRRRAQAQGAPRSGESQEERDRKHARNQRKKKRRK